MADSLESIDRRVCKTCGKEFMKLTYQMVFCSVDCRDKWWNDGKPRKNNIRVCKECGKEFTAIAHAKRCSKECTTKHRKYLRSTEYKNQHTDFENKRKQNTKYVLERLKNDPEFKVLHNVRSRFRTAVKGLRHSKNIKDLIGCDLQELMNHLQTTAINNGYAGFDINNYNSRMFHIDHKIPCSHFDFTNNEDILKCFHYTNLQILSAKENLIKRDKLVA